LAKDKVKTMDIPSWQQGTSRSQGPHLRFGHTTHRQRKVVPAGGTLLTTVTFGA